MVPTIDALPYKVSIFFLVPSIDALPYVVSIFFMVPTIEALPYVVSIYFFMVLLTFFSSRNFAVSAKIFTVFADFYDNFAESVFYSGEF